MTVRPGYISDGNNNWIQIGPPIPLGSTVYYQASEPATPQTGDIWIDSDNNVPSIDNSQFLRWRKTVSGGETSLSGLDDSGLSLQYTPAYEQVYLNGVLLVRGADYTATTGTSITGLTALAASDVVEVFSVVARVVGDVYTQSQTNSLLDAKSNISSTGLVLITQATIGSAVTSIVVNNVFSSTYDNYLITINGGVGSTGIAMTLQLGSTTSNYKSTEVYSTYTSSQSVFGTTTATSFVNIALGDTSSFQGKIDIMSPNLAKYTQIQSVATASGSESRMVGVLSNTTQYTGFTINVLFGTVTGGTIKVYGYK